MFVRNCMTYMSLNAQRLIVSIVLVATGVLPMTAEASVVTEDPNPVVFGAAEHAIVEKA